MISIDLKARMKNKAFWVAIVSALVLLFQQLGLNIIPKNYSDIVNTVLTILTMLGVVVDTSTPGVSDQISDSTSDREVSNSTGNETIK